MSDLHVHRNIDTTILSAHCVLSFKDETDLGGYDERFLPAVISAALDGKSCQELRSIYRATRSSLSTDNFEDEADRNGSLDYHVKHKLEAIRSMGFYRGLRRHSDAVLMTALAVKEAYDERIERSFDQTDETREWGGWEGTFRYNHSTAVAWMKATIDGFQAA